MTTPFPCSVADSVFICGMYVMLSFSVLKSRSLNQRPQRMSKPQSWSWKTIVFKILSRKHLSTIFHCFSWHHFIFLSIVNLGVVCRQLIHTHHWSCGSYTCWFTNGDTLGTYKLWLFVILIHFWEFSDSLFKLILEFLINDNVKQVIKF